VAAAAGEAIVSDGDSLPRTVLDCAGGAGAISSEGSLRWISAPRTAPWVVDCAPLPIEVAVTRVVRGPALTDWDVDVSSAAVEAPVSAAAHAAQKPPATAVPIPSVTASVPTLPT
jgi:hypothetical protein